MMKRSLETAKAETVVTLLLLCAVAVLAIPGEAYAFDAKDVPILMYHKVDIGPLPSIYWVSADDFRDQMFLLHDLGYETVGLDELYGHWRGDPNLGDVELPAKPVILTFDDAYENTYTRAKPLMDEYGFIGVAHTGPTDAIVHNDEDRLDNIWDTIEYDRRIAPEMIWSEVTDLYNAGWCIASHSKTHGHIEDINVTDEAYSRNTIRDETGIPLPKFYSYPFGETSTELTAALQAEGYIAAVGAFGGVENTGTMDIWEIKRTGVNGDVDLAGFASLISETVPDEPTLTINTTDGGSVQVNPDQPYYRDNPDVTLTATAAPNYTFDSWGGDLISSNNPGTITMDSDKTVTANFVFNGLVSVYNFDGITSPSGTHKAESGEIDVTDSMIEEGTFPARRESTNGWANWVEATTAEYTSLTGSDDDRYEGADPGNGDNAAMIFEFYIAENPADLERLDVSVEISQGDATDASYAYLWNYNTSSYLVLGSQAGITDQIISAGITTNPGDYIDPGTGQATVFVANEDIADLIRVDDISVTTYVLCDMYDLDCDGSIGVGDFRIMCENWLGGPDLPGDFYKDEDDIVNLLDFADFASVWGD